MTKRLFAICVTLFLLLSLLCVSVFADETDAWVDDVYASDPQTPEAPAIVFTDVLESDWFYAPVMDLTAAKVIDGFGDGTFRPSANVTTGQALKMILLAAGYPTPQPVASHWARGYLDLALEVGILERGEITDLDVTISRGLVAKIAALSLGAMRRSADQFFTDTNDDNIHALRELGIVGGYPDNSYKPERTLTRAELSAIVSRIYTHQNPVVDDSQMPNQGETIQLRTTEAGVDFIKACEGFVDKPYWDHSQYSVGYGSRCEKDDYPDGITKEEADTLLRTILAGIEVTLDKYLETHNLTLASNQYDALVSFTYNTGSGWMKNSRLSSLLTSKNYTENAFASAYGIWCHVGTDAEIYDGLINRRIRELKVFFDNDYAGNHGKDFCYLIFETAEGKVDVDIAFYRKGTTFDPYFEATSAGNTFLGWQCADGTTLTESSVIQTSQTVTALWQNLPDTTPDTTVPDDATGGGFEGGSYVDPVWGSEDQGDVWAAP